MEFFCLKCFRALATNVNLICSTCISTCVCSIGISDIEIGITSKCPSPFFNTIYTVDGTPCYNHFRYCFVHPEREECHACFTKLENLTESNIISQSSNIVTKYRLAASMITSTNREYNLFPDQVSNIVLSFLWGWFVSYSHSRSTLYAFLGTDSLLTDQLCVIPVLQHANFKQGIVGSFYCSVSDRFYILMYELGTTHNLYRIYYLDLVGLRTNRATVLEWKELQLGDNGLSNTPFRRFDDPGSTYILGVSFVDCADRDSNIVVWIVIGNPNTLSVVVYYVNGEWNTFPNVKLALMGKENSYLLTLKGGVLSVCCKFMDMVFIVGLVNHNLTIIRYRRIQIFSETEIRQGKERVHAICRSLSEQELSYIPSLANVLHLYQAFYTSQKYGAYSVSTRKIESTESDGYNHVQLIRQNNTSDQFPSNHDEPLYASLINYIIRRGKCYFFSMEGTT